MSEKKFELKEVIYPRVYPEILARQIKGVFSGFADKKFLSSVLNKDWKEKSLLERTHHITKCLGDNLPYEYEKALKILWEIAHLKRTERQSFADIIFPDFVEMFGLNHFDLSMKALEYFTRFSSAEFAIRPFILKYPKKTMEQMMEWTKHENYHVRRLASEGCRPKLPWGIALKEFQKNPNAIIPILEELKADPEDYVYRSVANNLNDISKTHPELVLKIAKKWKGKNKNTDWLVKHACRTLLKKGNPEAMQLFGYNNEIELEVKNLKIAKKTLKIGDFQTFSFEFLLKVSSKIRIEYAIDFVKSNGSTSRKVFKITENTYPSNKWILIERKQHFRDLTTRKHYPGKHQLSIIFNGKEKNNINFELIN